MLAPVFGGMRLLTPHGYKDVRDCGKGQEVISLDPVTAKKVCNYLETDPQWVDRFEFARWWNWAPPKFRFFRINKAWTFSRSQSIWCNGNVTHVALLKIGDVIYTERAGYQRIWDIAEIRDEGWFRLDVSGDHSFIADGALLHNASRFAITTGGVSWTAINTGMWAASSGGGTGSSVPGSADTATFDGASGGNTCTVNFGGTITVQSITCGAFTGTLDFATNNNSVTLSSTTGFSGTGSGTRTINLGNGTWTLSTTSTNATPWNLGTVTNLTFNANSSTIDFSGTMASGQQTMQAGGKTYSTVKISGARLAGGLLIGGGPTIGTLTNTAAASISIGAATTITTLTQGAQLNIALPSGVTTTITNAPTFSGTAAAPVALLNNFSGDFTTQATVSCASGTFGGTYCCIEGVTFTGGATFSFTNSFDLGKNVGATITAPSAGATGISRARAASGF